MSDDDTIPNPLSFSAPPLSRPFMSSSAGRGPLGADNTLGSSSDGASAGGSAMQGSAVSFLTADAYAFSGGVSTPQSASSDSIADLAHQRSQSQHLAQAPDVPPKPSFCCATHKALDAFSKRPLDISNPNILISDAQKTTDMTGSTFIVYIIRTVHPDTKLTLLEVKRRYSDFDSLRRSLAKIHPQLIVPPIPEKHSLTDYAVGQARARDDPHVIAKRKRMLQTFLNRVAKHSLLCAEHMFHRFLEPGSWQEVLTSTLIPASSSKSALQKLTEKSRVRIPDPHWTNSERYTANYSDAISIAYRANKRVLSDLSALASSLSDLGATYNAWSLHETALALACEKVGQACESQQRAVGTLQATLEEGFTEPLQEQGEFAHTVAKVLKWRKDRQVDLENVVEQLESKRVELGRLEKNETEAQRLQSALNYHGVGGGNGSNADRSDGLERPAPPLPHPPPPPRPTSILATLNSLIDNDPEATRRSSIARLRDKIIQLEEARRTKSDEVEVSGVAVQADLDRYQREKLKDLARMMAAYGRAWRDYARRGAQAWEEAAAEVSKIPEGP
ncbi:hypothetical protein M427DRAFT_107957 [Gonapodya prolifera JEL478]|uniref:PX domain-containing protein n=1 Tax=Gonapodya prolifera (strain JEL478) TaxID=1344416 RepID=A0A139AV40_GONPJ|nr:hypothetical protein M427DRAFT_107957 [Gonapodya prolifera JEL478]|eukprot:KXS20355.1 hypothetical protein M427DRAFT_107957 [Gonapodya prolifera JEL478]